MPFTCRICCSQGLPFEHPASDFSARELARAENGHSARCLRHGTSSGQLIADHHGQTARHTEHARYQQVLTAVSRGCVRILPDTPHGTDDEAASEPDSFIDSRATEDLSRESACESESASESSCERPKKRRIVVSSDESSDESDQ